MFELVDTHGIPLDLVLERLAGAGMVPDWLTFCSAAVAAGWKPSRLRTRLAEAVGDVHGPDYRVAWEVVFMAHFGCAG